MSDHYSIEERKGLINRDKNSDGKRVLPAEENIYDTNQPNKKRRNLIIGGIVVILIIIGIVLAIVFGTKKSDDNSGNDPIPPGPPPVPPIPSGYNPYFIDTNSIQSEVASLKGNIVYNQSYHQDFQNRFKQLLQDKKIGVNATQIPLGINNQRSTNISFEFGQNDSKISYLNIADQSQSTPLWSIPQSTVKKGASQSTMRLDMNNFQYNANPFYFSFSSTRNNFDTLLTTQNQTLFVSQKFIQMDIQLPSQRVFGFGERKREFGLSEGSWTMWSNGQQTPYDDGSGSLQTYGVHPFALVQCKQKTEFLGIFFRNSNAQSPILTFNDDKITSTLSYITTGGQLEIYFFTQGTAKQIIANYQRFVGTPQLPPFWSLGWHSSSKMLNTLALVQQNVLNYNKSGIPLESVWLDTAYMNNNTHFTVDNVAFNGLLSYTQTLHKNGIKLVPVVQAGLSFDDKGDSYVSQALTLGALVMNLQNKVLESQVLTNSTVFLDFFNNNSYTVWKAGLDELYNLMNYDGLWLDMNEPTTVCNGSYPICQSNQKTFQANNSNESLIDLINKQINFLEKQRKLEDINTTWYTSSYSQDNNSTYYLPFIPSNQWNLDNSTLSLNASNTNYTQYNTHSLFGHMQSQATWQYLSQGNPNFNDQRLFIQSRSTFVGTGKYASHSLGQNQRTFDDMKYSISGIMNFNMFGIPLVGPNICGFFSSNLTDDESELCGRWIQLSQFYPFARINGDNFADGNLAEPYNLNGTYQAMAKSAIIERFKYMAFLYTCLFQASQSGQTCFDPLIYHYPTIDGAFQNVEQTFIVGDALKVSPVLQKMEGQTEYQVFFPAGNWVSMKNLSDIISVNNSQGDYVNLTAPSNTVNVHLRPGYIVPVQNNTLNGYHVNNTSQLKNNPISLIVNRDTLNHAKGQLFISGDNTLSSLINNNFEYYEFSLFSNSINILNLNTQNTQYQGTDIQNIQIANAGDLINVTCACYILENTMEAVQLDHIWQNGTLTLMANEKNLSQTIKIMGIKQINFATEQNLSLCNLSSNWTQKTNYYYWDTLLDLSLSQSSAILKSNVQFLKDLNITATVLQNGILNLYWTFQNYQDLERIPFEVPKEIINVDKTQLSKQILSDYISINNQSGKPYIQVVNQQKNQILNIENFVLTEYFNQINSQVFVKNGADFQGIMGLSERVSNDVFLGDGVYSLWSRDIPDPVETGKAPGNNMYGTHPFYMARSTDDSWFGVFTNLANAQDWYLKNSAAKGTVNVSTYATGGVQDIYIMFGQDPNQVTQQYHTIVGTPVLIPQWALGWHQCRWGYNSTKALSDVVDSYSKYNIPLDTIWSDIDYLANYRDFHYDDENGFADLPIFVNTTLKNQNMHWIPIIDAGIAQRQDYDAYVDGINKGIFLKTYDNSTVFTGQVWPGDAVFPDFFNQGAVDYWQAWLGKLYEKINFDGLWHDMNEASNFCDGVCHAEQSAINPVQLKLPYLPTGRDLETKSIQLDAIHQGDILELDAHSLYGTMQSRAAHLYFQNQNKRTMIIQRSAYAGLGKFASRWLGDNWSQNEYMGYSVTGVMMHNVLGITLAGSDICGFLQDTNPELCARWHVVGSFYPFSRNHNSVGNIPQEPYAEQFQQVYSGTTTYTDIMRNSIYNKYNMVRYYYTQMSLVSQNGGAFYKPLFFEFPNDILAYQNQTDNIMLGSALKLSVLSTNVDQNQTVFYFPEGTWCQVFNTTANSDSCIIIPAGGQKLTLSSLAYQFYVHLRQGYIIPMQNASYLKIKNTADLQNQPVDFHIHPVLNSSSSLYQAQGNYLNDNGTVLNVTGYQNEYYFNYSHAADNKQLTLQTNLTKSASKIEGGLINMNDVLGRVEIYNAQNLKLTSNYAVAAQFNNGTDPLNFKNIAVYNASSQRLQFQVDSAVQINLFNLQFLNFTLSV